MPLLRRLKHMFAHPPTHAAVLLTMLNIILNSLGQLPTVGGWHVAHAHAYTLHSIVLARRFLVPFSGIYVDISADGGTYLNICV